MAEKRYYWLKLKETFFDDDNIRIIEGEPGGEKYLIFYLKLMLKSIKGNGELRHKSCIPYTPEILGAITHTAPEVAEDALRLLQKLKMVEVLDDGALFMAEAAELLGSESDSAERVRAHRERSRLLQCNTNVTGSSQSVTPDKEIELDTDREKDNSPVPSAEGAEVASGQAESLMVKTARGAGHPANHSMRLAQLFSEFWDAYPKKSGKGAAEKAFNKVKPSQELFASIMSALQKARVCEQWARDGGQFIPNPATAQSKAMGRRISTRSPRFSPTREAMPQKL